jgi:hypothetical protein
MISCPWPLLNPIIDHVKHWLHDWGDLVLTGVIAWAAIMQWVVASRLLGLTKTVENIKNRPLLFCRIKGDTPFDGLAHSSIEAQLSNLSSFGIWIHEANLVIDGNVTGESNRSFSIDSVLQAGATSKWVLFETPFADIVPIGSPKVILRIQIKFSYSASHTIGVEASPIYSMTIENTVVRELIVEKNSPNASLSTARK